SSDVCSADLAGWPGGPGARSSAASDLQQVAAALELRLQLGSKLGVHALRAATADGPTQGQAGRGPPAVVDLRGMIPLPHLGDRGQEEPPARERAEQDGPSATAVLVGDGAVDLRTRR